MKSQQHTSASPEPNALDKCLALSINGASLEDYCTEVSQIMNPGKLEDAKAFQARMLLQVADIRNHTRHSLFEPDTDLIDSLLFLKVDSDDPDYIKFARAVTRNDEGFSKLSKRIEEFSRCYFQKNPKPVVGDFVKALDQKYGPLGKPMEAFLERRLTSDFKKCVESQRKNWAIRTLTTTIALAVYTVLTLMIAMTEYVSPVARVGLAVAGGVGGNIIASVNLVEPLQDMAKPGDPSQKELDNIIRTTGRAVRIATRAATIESRVKNGRTPTL